MNRSTPLAPFPRRVRRLERGLTLIEVLVSLAVMALIASVLYGAFDGMARSRSGIERISDRYHEGRTALSRISRELQGAFISLHVPLEPNLLTQKTLLVGTNERPADRLDFTSFGHVRVGAGTHESDQCEISYFGSRNPNGGLDLVRRESKTIDIDPQHGGVVQVLAEDIESFDLQYLDGISGEWLTDWDTMNLNGEVLRLPQQVRVELVLRRDGGAPIPFVTKVPIPLQTPLQFAVPK
jgi:general secretion pathway protein J